MKLGCIFLTLFIGCFMLSACQPTPQQFSTDIAPVSSDPANGRANYVSEQDLSDGIKLKIDASVETTNELPYAEFVKREFSNEEITEIFYALCGEGQIFQCIDTKTELERQVLLLKSQLAQNENENDFLIQSLNLEIERLTESISVAPDTKPAGSLENILSYPDGVIEVGESVGPNALFQVSQDQDMGKNFISYTSQEQNRFFLKIDNVAPALTISEAEAIDYAQSFLSEIGINEDFSLAKCGVQYLEQSYPSLDMGAKESAYYNIVFLRLVNGASQSYSIQVKNGYTSPYQAPFYHEYIEFNVNDNGIQSFFWEEPGDLFEMKSTTSVLSLDDAISIFLEKAMQTYNKYYFDSRDKFDPQYIVVNIHLIRLGIASIMADPRTAYITPVWEFFGYIQYSPPGEEPTFYNYSSFSKYCEMDDVLCSINATNGEIIDRNGE